MVTAVFAGERGSFAELAALEYFGRECQIRQVSLFDDVFDAVRRSSAVRGMIPIENTRAGSVHRNYDLLLESGCAVVGEIYLKIRHCLIGNHGTSLKKVRRVLSHPQALSQCRRYLGRLSSIETEETVNTAAAVKMIRESGAKDAAAIASMQAAIDFDMKVIVEDIQDDRDNMTRFLVTAQRPRRSLKSEEAVKSSVIFSFKNMPGALFRSLAVFALRDIDLYKIESRPAFGQGFQYLFYLDFEGNATDERQQNALRHLQELTSFYRLLGSYPMGKTATPKYYRR